MALASSTVISTSQCTSLEKIEQGGYGISGRSFGEEECSNTQQVGVSFLRKCYDFRLFRSRRLVLFFCLFLTTAWISISHHMHRGGNTYRENNAVVSKSNYPLSHDESSNEASVSNATTTYALSARTSMTSSRRRLNLVNYMDPKSVVLKETLPQVPPLNIQQQPQMPQQSAVVVPPIESSAAGASDFGLATNFNLELPPHMQHQQQPQQPQSQAQPPVEGWAGTTASMEAMKNVPYSQYPQNTIAEMQIPERPRFDPQDFSAPPAANTNENVEIPQHMLPTQKIQQDNPLLEIKKNVFPADYTKQWDKEPELLPAAERPGFNLLEEIPEDLSLRWGEQSEEEEKVEVIILPNQEQECPIEKFNPEAQHFDFTSRNISISEKLQLTGYKDVWNWKIEPTDLPVFWHIPKSGGSTVKDIMGSCHRFVMATEAGIRNGHDNDTVLAIVKVVGKEGERDGSTPFVNVDTTSVEGIQRAKTLGLAQCGLAKVIVIRNVFESNILFDEAHKGRLFAVFRHPIDRQVSLFNYLKIATWEPTYNVKVANMTLKEYVRSEYVEYNWLTRYLSGVDKQEVLTQEHMRAAMDVVRRKFLVGLLSRKEETMERLEQFFEWTYRVNPKNQEICRDKLLNSGANANVNKGEKATPNTPTYEMLLSLNKYDIQLYHYIESLFDEQADFVKHKKDGFRMEGATCCKCHRYPQC